MEDTEIMEAVHRINYAALYVTIGKQQVKFGPGEDAWTRQLSTVSDDVRASLVEKVQRLQTRLDTMTACRVVQATGQQLESQEVQG